MKPSVRYISLALLVLLFLKGVWPSIVHPQGETNLFALQAEAFLRGTWDVGQNGHDVAFYQGHYYVVFPPFPALLITPFVWLFGAAHTNLVLISVGLTVLCVWSMYQIFTHFGVRPDTTAWVIAGFLMGTGFWMAVKASTGVWFFAHVVCTTALLLSFREALKEGRGWLVGLFFSMAFLSRQMTLLTFPFLVYVLWKNKKDKQALAWFLVVSCTALAIYLWINWFRFDDPWNTGYEYIPQSGYLKSRFDEDGLFHSNYLFFNFVYLFLQGFHVEFTGDSMMRLQCTDPFGTSLTFASPFVFTAFWARWKKGFLVVAWTSIILMILASGLYYTNGFYQINAQRFTLDFMPILIVLTALGADRCNPRIWKPFIVYSIALNLLASALCALSS